MGDKLYEILTWFRAMISAPKANSENPADKNSPELSEYKDIVNIPQTDFSMQANGNAINSI